MKQLTLKDALDSGITHSLTIQFIESVSNMKTQDGKRATLIVMISGKSYFVDMPVIDVNRAIREADFKRYP